MNEAVLKCVNQVKFYTFPLLDETGLVVNAFSTREGGVSEGIYSTMNLSFKLEDKRENVLKNIELFCDALDIDMDRIVMSNQTHSTVVKCVDERHIGTGIQKPLFTDDVDGLITNVPGVVLHTTYADCVPVYFFDTSKKVIGLSHSGWKGTYGEISKVTIEKMESEYDSNPKDIRVVIGPCICKKCYEVSKELAMQFQDKFGVDNDAIGVSDKRSYLDLSAIIKKTLLATGITEGNISIANVCTCCNSSLLHSHRATGGKRGLNAAVICLKD